MTSGAARATLQFQLDVKAAPAVELHGPPPGAVLAGTTQVEVVASASTGLALAAVRLLLDGAEVGAAANAPASFALDTAAVANGAHDLAAVAVDEIGNSTRTAPARVEVRNKGVGGGCASAAGEPLLALAAALAACPRRRRISSRGRAG